MKVGVLALQGAFIEHLQILRELEVEAVAVRLPSELEGLDALIIPGGESTTIGKLMIKIANKICVIATPIIKFLVDDFINYTH